MVICILHKKKKKTEEVGVRILSTLLDFMGR